MERKRENFIDILKGICILAIIFGHTKSFLSYEFITLFVPIFFIISGYLHNKNTDFTSFFIKKLKRLYLPFICFNLILPLIILIKRFYLGLEIKYNIIYIFQILLTFKKDGFLFGASWFLGSLFIVSVLIKILEKICKKNYLLTSAGYLLLCTAAIFLLNIRNDFLRTLEGGIFYLIGIFISIYIDKIKKIISEHKLISVFFAVILNILLFQNIYKFNYSVFSINNFIPLTIVAITLLFILTYFSKIAEKNNGLFKKFLCYSGEKSIYILLFHFVFFEIVTGFILKINGYPIKFIEHFPHVVCNSGICTAIYFLSGLFGSLLIAKLSEKIKQKIKKS